MAYDFDLITLGAGSGGVRASRMASGFGARVAVVEESRVGGTCVIRGCVPKKLLVYAAHFGEDFEDAAGYGWSVADAAFDWPTLIANKNAEIDRLNTVYKRILADAGCTLIEGRGRVVDANTVAVGGTTYTAERILVAVGGWPSLPDIPGVEHAITSNEALELESLPRRMVIVGGGYIAVEFAGIFAGLGVEVTQIVRAGNILRGFDEDIREALATEMRRKGVNIRCETLVRSIAVNDDGSYSLRLAQGEFIDTDLVMYATGRRPNTAGLGLEEAGVALDANGAVVVDANSRTSVPSIFAIGDVTDRMNLTPVALAEGRAFAETEFNANPMTVDYDDIPTAVFSQPPVGTVGLTEEEARRRGPVRVYASRFRPMRHTLAGREERTMMKLIVDADSDRVLGAHMVGPDAPEIVQGLGIALKCGATKAQFDATIGIHPTAAEEFVTMREPLPEASPESQE